jgi:hypothetical protein
MIKHLKPRTKKEILIARIKDFPTTIKCPWRYVFIKTYFRMKNDKWEEYFTYHGNNISYLDYFTKFEERRLYEFYPYDYTLENGKIYKRIAKISMHKFIYKLSWLKWTEKFKKEKRNITIDFYKVKEHIGAKGHSSGCSWMLLPNETPYEGLKRMERERKF